MPTQAFPLLTITDGTTSCVIGDGSGGSVSYQLDALAGAWRPGIAGFSQSQLGGRGPYDDVLETMTLDVTGATAAAATNNLQTLERLIGQAERWSRGENVAVVLIKFAPQGSTVATTAAPYQAVVMGYAPGANAACTSGARLLMMPAAAGSTFIIPGVVLTFQRRGAWLLSTAITGTSASVANPGPYPLGMTTHPNVSPAKIKISGFTAATSIDTTDGKPIVLLAGKQTDLQFSEAEVGVSGLPYISSPDTVGVARGGAVLRYTPSATTETLSGEIAFSLITASARRFAFFAAIRNNGATTYRLRLGALILARTTGAVNEIVAYTRPVVIDAAHTRPRFYPLGVVSLPAQLRSVQLAITASAASSTLDIDYIVALAVDNPYARAIQLDRIENTGAYIHTQISDLYIDPLPLSGLTPSAYRNFQTTTDNDNLGYYGDAYPVADSTEYTAAILCKRVDVPASWCYAPASGTGVSLTLTVSRYDARMVPE